MDRHTDLRAMPVLSAKQARKFCCLCRDGMVPAGTSVCRYPSRGRVEHGLDEVIWERVARNLNDADLKRWAEEAIEAERSKGTDAIKAEVAELQRALKAKQDSHANILRGFGDGDVDAETKKMLGTLAEDIAALRARLAGKKTELAAAKEDESAAKPKSPARMRATALKDLDAAQKRELFKMLIRRVELTPNSIVLNPFEGAPIVGEVKEREGVRSGRWRFIDVEWLN